MRKVLSALVTLATLMTPTSPAIAASIELIQVVNGLSSPVFVTHAHDGTNRLFILEQAGIIKVLKPGATTPTVFLDITGKVLFGGERGLLGLAFHPQYPSNPSFYVDYTRIGDGATVIAEYQVSGNPDVAALTEKVLLVIPQPYTNHKGGMLAFGPSDGYLYIGMGDGGDRFDPENRAQNVDQLLGKILRIDVNTPNGPIAYSSPSTNPFFGISGADEIFAYGFRNPWRFSFDRGTGDLYVGDVGQGAVEEVDVVAVGKNYGWRVWEGTTCNGLAPDPSCSGSGYTFPVVQYDHTLGRCSITGGYVYRGPGGNLPTGSYVFSDFCTGEIFLVEGGAMSVLLDTALNISSFGENESGEVFVVDLNGAIYRIVRPPSCTYTISPTTAAFGVAGGSGTVSVTAPAGCAWSAISNDSWIMVTSGSSGSGNGTVGYSVSRYTLKRKFHTGTMTIAGETFTVKQSR